MTVRSGIAEAGAARRYRASSPDEVDSASVYRAIAAAEPSPQLAEVYRNLAEAEERHADFWAEQLVADRETALDTLVREELGIDPGDLGSSARSAGAASFVLFAIGAVVPVVPFVLLAGSEVILASLAVSAVALFAIGGAITLFTGRGLLYSGGRQVAIGLGAAALTSGVGRVIGVAVG